MSKTYDMLMKSAKFTAAQNKEENGEYVNAVGELVFMAEKEGFIPRYYTDKPGDKVDETIADLRGYTDTLVREELNLGNLIEGAVRTMSREEEKEEDEDLDDEEVTLEDIDFEAHYNFLEQEQDEDTATFDALAAEEES